MKDSNLKSREKQASLSREVSRVQRTQVAKEIPQLVAEDVARLADIFPPVVVEGKVDFKRLQETLGDFVDNRPEKYSFTWAGKRDAIQILQMPTRATLVPLKDQSVDFDKTQNLFIEGDNLEVLKLLYKPYFGRVKMIYIDPPYNTGNDFVYRDDYTDPLEAYLKITGQKNEEGNLLTSNPETSGRYHSTWLSMMYPRLFLGKQLLIDGGLIFVSIDEHEVHNLRFIMNEIFGEENFIAEFVWKARSGKMGTISQVSFQHEYILCYQANTQANLKKVKKVQVGGTHSDEKGSYRREQLRQWGQGDRREDRPRMWYPIRGPKGVEIYPIKDDGSEGRWRCGKSKAEEMLSNGELDFEFDGKHWQVYRKIREGYTSYSAHGTVLENVGTTADGTKVLVDLLGGKVMDFPKPPTMIQFLIDLATWDDDEALIMDFFAGSCSTAQAVMDMNKADGGNRRFIMIQLPEPTSATSVARKEGFDTIAEIGKERIRRVIKRFQKEKLTNNSGVDLGFRVFKLSESNYQNWRGVEEKSPQKYAAEMSKYIDPLVPHWKKDNVIYEVAIKEGYSLSVEIEKARDFKDNEIFRIVEPGNTKSFWICLDDTIRKSTIRALNLGKEDLFVCRDVALDDSAAANLALTCRLNTI